MSEYWVSKKKYFCKYCEIYIADDGPSRQQHENGLRHKGNRDRFIRGLYKDGEKRKKDLEEEKREMARVELAAQAAFSQDVGAGIAKASAPAASTSSASRKPPPKPSNPFSNYSTAASLGYTDPDAERIAAETARRQTQGVAGEWEMVVSSQSVSTALSPSETLKRAADDENDTRSFKLQKKTLGTGLGQIYDPGVITLKPKKKEQGEDSELDSGSTSKATTANSTAYTAETRATETPKWTSLQWKRPGEKVESGEPTVTDSAGSHRPIGLSISSTSSVKVEPEASNEPTAKVEDSSVTVKAEASDESTAKVENDSSVTVKAEAPSSSNTLTREVTPGVALPQVGAPSLFKKRKVPGGGSRGRRQL